MLLQALGFKLGVFHVELKATSRGPRLIEVNARMGGGGVRCGAAVVASELTVCMSMLQQLFVTTLNLGSYMLARCAATAASTRGD
jgi:hypothetical protein